MSYVEKITVFTDLRAWQQAHALVLMIYKLTESFPDTEKFGLISQLRRAAVSISSNIAEGFRRRGAAEKRQFYTFALSSLTEVENQLLISRDVSYLDHPQFSELSKQCDVSGRLIKGLLRSATAHFV